MHPFLLALLITLNVAAIHWDLKKRQEHLAEHLDFYDSKCWRCSKEALLDGVGRGHRNYGLLAIYRFIRRERRLRSAALIEWRLK